MSNTLAQDVTCPQCGYSWDIPDWRFLRHGDEITCPRKCGAFTANEATVRCCVDGPGGLEEIALQPLPPQTR